MLSLLRLAVSILALRVLVLSVCALLRELLRWGLAWAGIRQEVEAALPRSLPGPGKNPVAGWMFTAAVSVMVAMLLWLVVLVYIMVTPPPK